jgi:hypothetical protein
MVWKTLTTGQSFDEQTFLKVDQEYWNACSEFFATKTGKAPLAYPFADRVSY